MKDTKTYIAESLKRFDDKYDIKNVGEYSQQIIPNNGQEYPIKSFLSAELENLARKVREEMVEEKCPCCDIKDEHLIPGDRSTTRISRPCGGCNKHQTIAGALLKSKYWQDWYEYASKNMLYDVDETLTVDAMSDGHFDDFIKFTNQALTSNEQSEK